MNIYCRNFAQFYLLVLIVVALGLLCRPPIVLAASPSKLVIGYASTTPRLMPLWVARDQGFFAKYGIESEPVLLRSGATLVTGMASGDVQIGRTAGAAVLSAVSERLFAADPIRALRLTRYLRTRRVDVGFDEDAGVFRVVNVWDSREQGQAYLDDRILPAVREVLGEGARQPARQGGYELHHLLGHARSARCARDRAQDIYMRDILEGTHVRLRTRRAAADPSGW